MAQNTIIGRGEATAKKILEFIFPDRAIMTQYSISRIHETFSEIQEEKLSLSEIHAKSSVDILILPTMDKAGIAVRIQHGSKKGNRRSGHLGLHKSAFDAVQRKDLEAMGLKVVDILESDGERYSYYGKDLFEEKLTPRSVKQVVDSLVDEGVYE